MTHIQKDIKEHLVSTENIISFRSFSNESLCDWAKPIYTSIDEDGSIPYLIEKKERYRASPLASTIIWLSRESLLPDNVLGQMQERLLYLRDNKKSDDVSSGCNEKHNEDNDGWSLSEGVSVWSTSMAIIALLDCRGIGVSKALEFKKSVIWLANQRDLENKGWGYQKSSNCSVNVIMSALAVRALALAFSNKYQKSFEYNEKEKELITESILKGIEYLVESCKQSKKYIYWEFNGTPNCAATTWSLMALKESLYVSESATKEFLEKNINKGLLFVVSKMPKKIEFWEEEKIVEETGAKYDSQKNYYSFSATLIPELISLGLSPYHIKIVNQIQWIVDNRANWKTKYDKKDICYFTYSMLIATIVCWVRHVGGVNAKQLLNQKKSWIHNMTKRLLGYSFTHNTPMVCIEKSKLIIYMSVCVALIVFAFCRTYIFDAVEFLLSKLTIPQSSLNAIFINTISSAVYAALWFILHKFIVFLKKLFCLKGYNNK